MIIHKEKNKILIIQSWKIFFIKRTYNVVNNFYQETNTNQNSKQILTLYLFQWVCFFLFVFWCLPNKLELNKMSLLYLLTTNISLLWNSTMNIFIDFHVGTSPSVCLSSISLLMQPHYLWTAQFSLLVLLLSIKVRFYRSVSEVKIYSFFG